MNIYESHTIDCYSTDNLLIITNPKIASSTIRNFYRLSDVLGDAIHLPNLNIWFNRDEFSWSFEPIERTLESLENSEVIRTINSIELLLQNKLQKDVLVCIRNPLDRFCSAFVQDYIKPMLTNQTFGLVGSLLLRDYQSKHDRHFIDIKQFKQYSNELEHESESEKFDKEVNAMMKPYLKIIFKQLLDEYASQNAPLNFGHNPFYHTFILCLISTLNIDRFKIIDIDEQNLIEALNFYEIGAKPQQSTNVTKHLGLIIQEIILEDGDNGSGNISLKIKQELKDEMLSYLILNSKTKSNKINIKSVNH